MELVDVLRLDVLQDERHEFFNGTEAHGLARIHMLDAAGENASV
jgi:hypothetical protein